MVVYCPFTFKPVEIMKKMLSLLIIVSGLFLFAREKSINIIPRPAEIEMQRGKFIFNEYMPVGYSDESILQYANMFIGRINKAAGFNLRPKHSDAGNIQFILNKSYDRKIGDEGYVLRISDRSLVLSANKPAGILYGVQTLFQLLPNEIFGDGITETEWSVPAVKIIDYPCFGWRGIMLDVSRHFFDKEEVKRVIDEISQFKFNTLHLHLTDDHGWRVEIKSYPKLTGTGAWRVERQEYFNFRKPPGENEPATYGGFYTRDDIRELVTYAQKRNISIVPEIDVPGHCMAAIASYPELSCSRNTDTKVDPGTAFTEWFGNGKFKMNIDNSLNPSDENVYKFLDSVFGEIAEIFPSDYIHIGGDECYKGYWEQDENCRNLAMKLGLGSIDDLQGYFMKRVEDIIRSKGKKVIAWDELLHYDENSDATVMIWRDSDLAEEAVKKGKQIILSPNAFSYLDFQQGEKSIEPEVYSGLRLKTCYSFEPAQNISNTKYILGGQGNLWTEQIPTFRQLEYMLFPRCWAISETYWSPGSGKNWDDFISRTENQFLRSDFAGINYSRAIYDPILTCDSLGKNIRITMSTEANNLDIYYTTDNTMPDNLSNKYSEPVILPSDKMTLRVITYRNGIPMGHLIILTGKDLRERIE